MRQMLLARAASLPAPEVVGYLEIGGPKLGRDYSDQALARQLRASLAYLREVWPTDGARRDAVGDAFETTENRGGTKIIIPPHQ